MPNLHTRITRIENNSTHCPFIVWKPDKSADAVQIGHRITQRMPDETIDELLDRAIRDYPDKRAKLILVGWQDRQLL